MSLRKPASTLAALCLAGAASAAPDVQPGLWETTVTTEMPGMPMAIPPMTTRSCIQDTDLVPDTRQPGQECELIEHSVEGNRVSWQIRCSSEGTIIIGNGELTYAGDTYTGEVRMNMQQGGQSMQMTQSLQGRRIGECP